MDSPPPAPSRSNSAAPSRTHSSDALLESCHAEPLLHKSYDGDLDAVSDSVTSSSDTLKRKRNFMDRCVNKVRSLIKK